MELSSGTLRSSVLLPRLMSFRNQLNLNKDLNGNELRHFQTSSSAAETDFRNQLNFNKDLIGTELSHSQICSTAAETDFVQKGNELE